MSNRGIWSDLPGKRTKILNATCTPLYAQAAQHALAKGSQASRRRRGMALSIGALLLAAAVALPAGWLSVQHQSQSAFRCIRAGCSARPAGSRLDPAMGCAR